MLLAGSAALDAKVDRVLVISQHLARHIAAVEEFALHRYQASCAKTGLN